MNKINTAILALALAGVHLLAGPATVHIVKSGETAGDLAKKYFGDVSAKAELLGFNRITNEAELVPGFPLVVPGEVRSKAATAVNKLDAYLQRAKDAQCETFSPEEFRSLNQVASRAKAMQGQGAFELSRILADEMPALTEHSLKVAASNAMKDLQATVADLAGKVEISKDDGNSWSALSTGDNVNAGEWVRTLPNSRAVLQVPNEVDLTLDSDTVLEVASLQKDLRNGELDGLMKVKLGEILGKVRPRARKMPIKVQTGRATIAIRGSTTRAGIDAGGIERLSNLVGNMDIEVGAQKLSLPANTGLVAAPGKAPVGPVPTPPLPLMQFPEQGKGMVSAQQTVAFSWKAAAANLDHRIEIASDPSFLQILDDRRGSGTTLVTSALPDGNYFWRVSSIDELGLQSSSYREGFFSVKTNLEIKLGSKSDHRRIGEQLVTSPGVVYSAEPFVSATSVVGMQFEVNNRRVSAPNGELTLHKTGLYNIMARGEAANGATGPSQNLSVYVDGDGPRIRMHFSDEFEFQDKGRFRALSLIVDDRSGVSKTSIKVNDKTYDAYTGPILLKTSQAHAIRVEASDSWGNRSARDARVKQGAGGAATVDPLKASPSPAAATPTSASKASAASKAASSADRPVVPRLRSPVDIEVDSAEDAPAKKNWFQRIFR